ncbi:hypothetical protein BGX28_008873 [Mortierella sp. GBA30]|nr:hypothetical protein BGX28_008873 [Mortierella sp. GBA30]
MSANALLGAHPPPPQQTNGHSIRSPTPVVAAVNPNPNIPEPGGVSDLLSTSSAIVQPLPLPSDRSSAFIENLVRAANGSVGLQDHGLAYHYQQQQQQQQNMTASNSSTSLASVLKENQPLPRLPPRTDQQGQSSGANRSSYEDRNRDSDKPLPLYPNSATPQPQDPNNIAPQEHPDTLDRPVLQHSPIPYLPHQNRHRSSSSASAPYPAHHEFIAPRLSLDHPPPYSRTAGDRGSTLIAAAPPTEENLFQIQEWTQPASGGGPLPTNLNQYVCANPMHDQQYLLVGSGNALHSIDLTLPADKQSIRTHIQGTAFKEIHCLEDIGLVVVIAGRNSRVRCYDYDAIKRLVSYGHSKEGRGRIVEEGKLGAMRNMIQLRVETALSKDDNQPSDANSSPQGQSRASRLFKGSSPSTTPQPQQTNRHQHTNSTDRSLLSPPARSNSPCLDIDTVSKGESSSSSQDTSSSTAATNKKSKQRPLSFGGLASLAQEHVLKSKGQQQQQTQVNTSQPAISSSSSSTPTSPSTGSSRSRRLAQMANYLSQAAANANMAAHMTYAQDAPSEEAVAWAADFTKLKQTKDVLGLDFHYTASTVFMTILSKAGIDIYSRPRSARGRQAASWSSVKAGQGSHGTGASDTPPGRPISSYLGGMASSSNNNNNTPNPHLHRDSPSFEWKSYKQFYHPEAPSFMTVVKGPQEVTDIILGKGPRACVINVEDMSVTDLHRQETSSVLHGISKKLGFRNSSLWHSFDKIPFDLPPHILYPAAAEALYGYRDSKEQYATYGSEQQRPYQPLQQQQPSVYVNPSSSISDVGRSSRDDILQRPSDQQTMHQQELDEQDQAEAQALAMKLQQSQLQVHSNTPSAGGTSATSSSSSLTSSSSSPTPAHQTVALPATTQQHQHQHHQGNNRNVKKTRMVTSDEVLNKALTQRTTGQLFLATYGSQSRIVDLQGKPQSRIVLDWESFPPQKVEFLKTNQDIYVIGFEKTSIVIFSLTRAKKIKEISKKDLVNAAASVLTAMGTGSSFATTTAGISNAPTPSTTTTSNTSPSNSSSSYSSTALGSSFTNTVSNNSSGIKFLGRDNIADDSLGIFFSYCHPKNGVSICKLGILPVARDELELVGYYP